MGFAIQAILSLLLLLLVVTSNLYNTNAETVTLDATTQAAKALSAKLLEYGTNVLGVKGVQGIYDNLALRDASLRNGSVIIEELSTATAALINSRANAVNELAAKVAQEYQNPSSTSTQIDECCSYSKNLVYDPRFRTRVDSQGKCNRFPAGHTNSFNSMSSKSQQDVRVSNAIKPFMVNLLQQYEAMKWVYFGSSQGVYTIAPAAYRDSCNNYDNRFRPWYVAASTKPKVVVLILDSSGSMSTGTRMATGQQAAKAVLNTLNPDDWVNVIDFDSSARTLSQTDDYTCTPGSVVLRATPKNIDYLTKFVDEMNADGGTNFDGAFSLAYSIISTSRTRYPQLANYPTAILFMTDGESTAPTTLPPASNPPVVFAFGFGSGVTETAVDVLSKVAKDSGGVYVQISDGTDSQLRTAMSSYYLDSRFSVGASESNNRLIMTVPYVDASGLGMVTTLAKAVYVNDQQVGVVGVDLTLTELLGSAAELNAGDFSYAFVVDSNNRTLAHPNLPLPQSMLSDPVFVNIASLESPISGSLFSRIQASLATGGSGSIRANRTRRFVPSGAGNDGTLMEYVSGTYFWKTTNTVVGPMTFGLFLADSAFTNEKEITPLPPSSTNQYSVYNRFNLTSGYSNLKKTTYYGREVTTDTSTIFFASRMYKNSANFLEGQPQTTEDVSKIDMYINRDAAGVDNSLLEVNAQTDARATVGIDTVWKQSTSEFGSASSEQTIWRYIGTASGAYRIFPGVTSSNFYDPALRPWYQRALRNPGRFSMSTPYLDAAGAGTVLTLSYPIYRASPTVPVAVLGLDFSVPKFKSIVEQNAAICANGGSGTCYLIDRHGFVIFKTGEDISESKFIGRFDPSISAAMVKLGVSERLNCVNYGTGELEAHFNVNVSRLTGVSSSRTITDSCGRSIYISALAETNLYLIAMPKSVEVSSCSSDSSSCASSGSYSYSRTPTPSGRLACGYSTYSAESATCPCVVALPFSMCKISYVNTDAYGLCAQSNSGSTDYLASSSSSQLEGWEIAVIVIAILLFLSFCCCCFQTCSNEKSTNAYNGAAGGCCAGCCAGNSAASKPPASNTNTTGSTNANAPTHNQNNAGSGGWCACCCASRRKTQGNRKNKPRQRTTSAQGTHPPPHPEYAEAVPLPASSQSYGASAAGAYSYNEMRNNLFSTNQGVPGGAPTYGDVAVVEETANLDDVPVAEALPMSDRDAAQDVKDTEPTNAVTVV